VPGVPPGAFAIALKVHHCVMDGGEVVELLTLMHDLAADGPRPAAPESRWRPTPLPSTASLLSRTAMNGALHPFRAGRVLVPSALRAVRGLPGKLGGGAATGSANEKGSLFAPKTRFNEVVSPHRVFEARFHDLADFRRIKALIPGATINDVALAYVGGALHKYLSGHGELPGEALVAFCPVSLREPADRGTGGNRLWGMMQSLQTTIADPLERLAAIAESTATYRAGSDQTRTARRLELAGTLPTALLGRTMKAAGVLPLSAPIVANTVVTNVRGPAEPFFFHGARLLQVVGMGPLIAGLNLFHAVESYNGSFSIGVTADRDALPDPAAYAECMDSAFRELLAAAR
jgi:diacylglycerol O-acyltransferase / wax synthase